MKLRIPKASALNDRNAVEDRNIRADKRAVLESLTTDEILELLNTEPIEFAVGSEKYENGKSRSIYAVEILHYIYNSFCTQGLEERFYMVDGFEKGLTGIKEYAGMQMRANITQAQIAECSMFDYADFNIQHTPKAQALIFEALADIGTVREFSPDWINACKWTAAAKYNSKFSIPMSDTLYPSLQGMFSGTRSTDLINSILNLAYFNTANNYLASWYNIEPIKLHHVHQGDDVWLSNNSRHYAAMFFYIMNTFGFRFQQSKQMFGRGYREFLRVLYNPDGGRGYAVRAIVNYYLKPIQNQKILDVREQCRSLSETYYTLQRRGLNLNVLNTMYECDLIYWACVRIDFKDNHPARLPAWIIQLNAGHGGFGCPRPGQVVATSLKIDVTPTLTLQPLKGRHLLKMNMTEDWITHVSQAFGYLKRNIAIPPPFTRACLNFFTLKSRIRAITGARRVKSIFTIAILTYKVGNYTLVIRPK